MTIRNENQMTKYEKYMLETDGGDYKNVDTWTLIQAFYAEPEMIALYEANFTSESDQEWIEQFARLHSANPHLIEVDMDNVQWEEVLDCFAQWFPFINR